ncbi:nucleotide sugar dehydrogenase [Arthrobacter sp. AET 35A]|uniref:nucleotide sugar dehydrogenase n=1 Tax=Arthrobacter sp. AET 35A TaxID=2292643 RepID=UPI00178470AE|nr:nucleotide sugar dehydrogenase [Arthrobacter sp. AET 35A]MBE0011704.1 nucleotide sugar dehydrogenase [Arthrobacter sp. AET 35A]
MSVDLVIVGQGYVGLPLAYEASIAGLVVSGFEVNASVARDLNLGHSHVDDISDEQVSTMIACGYSATTDSAIFADASVIVICVPTPLKDGGSPDLKYVEAAGLAIANQFSAGTLVVLESTTYPGTTEDVLRPILESTGRKSGQDFYLAFSPERIDPGNPNFGIKNTPKVVGGVDEASTQVAVSFYSKFVDTVVPVKRAREAETAKLLENTYRHVNIALVNEMAKFCNDLNIDLWEVIAAAKTKPFGFQAFYPGPGVGGHCIPIDPNYLSFEVRKQLNYPFRFVELAEEINNSMPLYVVRRVQEILNGGMKSVNGASILLLGVTYKADIADQRESPAAEIADGFSKLGARVEYHDPYVEDWSSPEIAVQRTNDLDESIQHSDVVVLLQNHTVYDTDSIAEQSKAFFDTRGTVKNGLGFRL